jgi:hypothetical protein
MPEETINILGIETSCDETAARDMAVRLVPTEMTPLRFTPVRIVKSILRQIFILVKSK